MRLAPCCWITGSATPSSLTRLCSVVMFCRIAADCTRLAASGFQRTGEAEVAGVGVFEPLQVGQLVFEQVLRGRAGGGIAEADGDAVAVADDAGVADVLVAQQRADVAGQRVGLLGQRRLHVDFHQEVDAAAQVEAEIHRQRVDRRQPARRARQQVERHHVALVARVGVQRGGERVLGLALGVEIGEAGLDGVAVELDEVRP